MSAQAKTPRRTRSRINSDAEAVTDRGVSLVEVVIAVALTGTVVISILGALFTVVRSSDQNEEATSVQVVVGGAADALADATWVACPEIADSYLGSIRSAALRVGWEVDAVTIDDIDYWNPTSNDWTEECTGAAAVGTSERLQRVSIRVTSPDGSVSKSFDVVKSDTTPMSGDSRG